MAKSVDKIIKGLNKLVDQLDACANNCITEMDTQDDIISVAEAKRQIANDEQNRATRIQNKLLELLK